MTSDALMRYLQRLPTFITFFFSVMLVTVFRQLGDMFLWTTGPAPDLGNLASWLVILSFSSTLFFVVAVWLGYALLIERFPYTLEYSHFIFDVVRFSVVYMIFEFAFLAAHPPTYFYFIGALGVFHTLMAGWHGSRMRGVSSVVRAELFADIRGHLFRAGVYYALTIIYLLTVTLNWQASGSWTMHAILVVITSAVLVFWNAERLRDMKAKALKAHADALAASATAAAPAK
ncbi:MAG TPA: hypothetical protein VL418_06255 [Devosiaceae bacterium]|jgi:hypothetical protein|nr:hypothetical protein [Devosiaceae bacterium]